MYLGAIAHIYSQGIFSNIRIFPFLRAYDIIEAVQ